MTKFELQEVLRKKGDQLRISNYKSYLESEDLCWFSFFLESNCTIRDLFGNILQPGVRENIRDSEGRKIRVTKSDVLKLIQRTQKSAKKKVFRRGYNDHGSLPAADERVRRQADEDFGARLQIEIELERNTRRLKTQLDYLATLKLFEEVKQGIS